MKHLCIALLLLLLARGTWAAKRKSRPPKPVQTYDMLAVKPLDTVFKHLDELARHPKDRHARALGRAETALETKKTAMARALASRALGSQFADYAHWVIAIADLMDAEAAASANKSSAHWARLAFNHLRAVEEGSPYSPLLHQVPRELGLAELWIADGLSPSREAVHHFEDALMRLSASGNLFEVTPDQVLRFAQDCKKSPDDLCSRWIFHLTERMNHGTDQFESIANLFPNVLDRPGKPILPPRATQAYHAPDLDSTAFDDAMTSVSSGNWAEAQDKLTKFLDEFPKSSYRYRARYWLARSLVEQNQKDAATKEYLSLEADSPLSYYGLLSAMQAGKPFDQPITKSYPQALDRDPLISASELYHLKRAEILLSANADELASMDLREIRPRSALSSPFLMYLCALNYRAKSYPMLFVLLSELIQRGYPDIPSQIGLKMIFPLEHLSEIHKYAKDNDLDPVLVLSLIKQESAFDPHAMSGVGAAGLMQLMYFTATQMSPGISRDDLMDPTQNIRTGTKYLSNLLTRYHGNIVFALSAYNAGPAATDRWAREAAKQKLDMLRFIESIPYRETRDYVSSIIRNYYWYSELLGAQKDPDTAKAVNKPLDYFWKPYSVSP